VWSGVGCKNQQVIERILRAAQSFEEVEKLDRQDMARLSLEERVSAVEQMRRTWFGEAPTQSRLDRILVATDLEARSLRSRAMF
jgi:endonuclease/exonuclease/phosphatase family metal-dependent hydrolase